MIDIVTKQVCRNLDLDIWSYIKQHFNCVLKDVQDECYQYLHQQTQGLLLKKKEKAINLISKWFLLYDGCEVWWWKCLWLLNFFWAEEGKIKRFDHVSIKEFCVGHFKNCETHGSWTFVKSLALL